MQSRLKSPVLWTSMVTLVAFISKNYFGWEIPHVDELIDLMLVVFTGFGIVNNPTRGDGM